MRKIKKSLYELITKKVSHLHESEPILVDSKDINSIITTAMKYQELVYMGQRAIMKSIIRIVYIAVGITLLYLLLR